MVAAIGAWEFWVKDWFEEDTITVGPVGNQIDVPIENITDIPQYEYANITEMRAAVDAGEDIDGKTVQINEIWYVCISGTKPFALFRGRARTGIPLSITDELWISPPGGNYSIISEWDSMLSEGDRCALIGDCKVVTFRATTDIKLYNATVIKLS